MARYNSELSLRDAREIYFALNGFDNGGYDEKWVKMKAGPIPIAFPNTQARLRAVKFHDLHHVLTGYETTWTGEAEIGAWEVATGCADHYPAWILNLYAFAIGLIINPRNTYRAFLRGRQSSNLYRLSFNDELLSHRVGTVRQSLHLDQELKPATLRDRAAFLVWAFIAITFWMASGLVMLSPFLIVVGLLIFWLMSR